MLLSWKRITLPPTVDDVEALECRRAISFALEIGLQNVVFEGDSNTVISYLKELRLALLVWHLLFMLLRIPTFWLCRSVLVLFSMYVERVMLWLIN